MYQAGMRHNVNKEIRRLDTDKFDCSEVRWPEGRWCRIAEYLFETSRMKAHAIKTEYLTGTLKNKSDYFYQV